FYDYFLTLSDEMRLVWPSKWSTIKVLFYTTRYCAFIDAAFVIFGKYFVTAYLESKHLLVILIIRTWAIWGRDRNIAGILGVEFCAFCIVGAIYVSKVVDSVRGKYFETICCSWSR
ncbi:hypothetical protein BDP27DRAFT_1232016, partial [Rhodocollybia butyracea]